MCGIVGYIGKRRASDVVIEGLKILEYRGYDSAGIALFEDQNTLAITKKVGYVSRLQKAIDGKKGCCGVGHTRWATHGTPSETNSHPHQCGDFCLVHNGIIENFDSIKKQLVKQGKKFLSQTDSEVVAVLLDSLYNGNVLETLGIVAKRLKGSFALAILHKQHPDKIFVLKNKSPLVIGLGDGECFVSSDPVSFAKYTNQVVYLKDKEMAIVTKDNATLFDYECNKKVIHLESASVTPMQVDGNIKSFTYKEIFEVPKAVRHTANDFFANPSIEAKAIDIFTKNDKLVLIGCGTAYNACLVGEQVLQNALQKPCQSYLASEFRYANPLIDKKTLVIAVSQSGETADTIEGAKLAKSKGASLLVISNVAHSSLTRLADLTLHTKAGCEVAVAATKSYVTQILLFLCLACVLNKDSKAGTQIKKQIETLPFVLTQTLALDNQIKKLANLFCKKQNVFFVGRGLDYPLAVEGALKLKEVSYINSQGFAAGELKHGSLALVDKNALVIGIVTQKHLADKTASSLHEVTSRGGKVLLLTQFDKHPLNLQIDGLIKLPKTLDLFMPMVAVLPLQLFAYHASVAKGLNPDRPRNLAKSVTVE